MEDKKQKLGRRIRELRESSGMTQQGFAFMVGMNRSYLGCVERGKKNITFDGLDKIACGLDVPLDELFKGVSQDTDSQQ